MHSRARTCHAPTAVGHGPRIRIANPPSVSIPEMKMQNRFQLRRDNQKMSVGMCANHELCASTISRTNMNKPLVFCRSKGPKSIYISLHFLSIYDDLISILNVYYNIHKIS